MTQFYTTFFQIAHLLIMHECFNEILKAVLENKVKMQNDELGRIRVGR